MLTKYLAPNLSVEHQSHSPHDRSSLRRTEVRVRESAKGITEEREQFEAFIAQSAGQWRRGQLHLADVMSTRPLRTGARV